MMEDENKIDKIFEDSLNQQVFDIPDDFLSDLNNRLDALEEKKKKRGIIWWFFTFLGFFGVVAVSFYLIQANNNHKPQNNKYITENSFNENLELDSLNNIQLFNQRLNDSLSTNEDDLKNSQSTVVNENSNDEHNKVYLGINEKHSNLNKSKNVSSKKGKTKRNADISNHQLDLNSSSNKKNKDVAVGGEKNKVNTNSEGIQNNKESHDLDSKEINENKSKQDINKELANQPNDEPTKKDETKNETPPAVSNNLSSGTNDKSKKEVKPWEKELQLYVGAGKNFVNEGVANYMIENKVLKEQELPLTPTFGANLNLYKNNYSYSLGVSFNQISEKFTAPVKEKFQKDTVVYDYTFGVDTVWTFNDTTQTWDYYLDEYVADSFANTSTLTKTKTELQNFHNRYSWVTIPFSFGYKFEFGNYALIPRVGFQFNIGMRKAGRYPWPHEYTNSVGVIDVKPVQVNVSYMLQFELRRTFNNWHVFVNPYFKSMLSNAIYVDSIVRRKYSTIGVQAGVGLRF